MASESKLVKRSDKLVDQFVWMAQFCRILDPGGSACGGDVIVQQVPQPAFPARTAGGAP